MPLGGLAKGIRSCSIRKLADHALSSPGREPEQSGAEQYDRGRLGHGAARGSSASASANNPCRGADGPFFEARGIILRAKARCRAGDPRAFLLGCAFLFPQDTQLPVDINKPP